MIFLGCETTSLNVKSARTFWTGLYTVYIGPRITYSYCNYWQVRCKRAILAHAYECPWMIEWTTILKATLKNNHMDSHLFRAWCLFQMLLSSIGTILVLCLYAIVILMVFAAAFLLPVETMGRRLAQTSNEPVEAKRFASWLSTNTEKEGYHTFSEKAQ